MNGFKKFILRGNVVDLAVGVVIGAAFTLVVNTFVSGLITPLTALAGGTQFDQLTWCLHGSCSVSDDGTVTGPLMRYGTVLSALLNFLIVATVIYFFVVRPVQVLLDRFKTEPEMTAPTKECPECLSSIPQDARRCAYCTVQL